jgi:hypothetical protein
MCRTYSDMENTNTKIAWENLPEETRAAWTEQVISFYPPNTVSPSEVIELARDEYNDAETLLPVVEACEVD